LAADSKIIVAPVAESEEPEPILLNAVQKSRAKSNGANIIKAPEFNDSYSVGSDDGIDFREIAKRKQHAKKQKKRLPVEEYDSSQPNAEMGDEAELR